MKAFKKIILMIFSLFFVIACSSEEEEIFNNLVEKGIQKQKEKQEEKQEEVVEGKNVSKQPNQEQQKKKKKRIERNGVVIEIRGSEGNRVLWFKKGGGSEEWKEMKDLRFKGFKGADSDSLPAFPDELKKEKPGFLKDLSFSKGKFQVIDLDGDMWVSADGEEWILEQFGGGGWE